MKHRISFIAAIWWIIICLIAGIFLMGVSDKESRISETENRMLQGFPRLSLRTIFNDEFTAGFESFLSDAFFGRDEVVTFTNGLLNTLSVASVDENMAMEAIEMEAELQTGNLRIEGAKEEIAEEIPAEAEAADIPGVVEMSADSGDLTVEEEDAPEEEVKIVLEEGRVPITDKNSFLYYKLTDGSLMRNYTYEKSKISTYADTLRIMQTYLPADGSICFAQVPMASMANRWVYQQDEFAGWGSTVELMLENCLEGTERIHVFNTYAILEPYVAGKTPMFYHTDHHWTAEGAYKVFEKMMETLGMPVIPYDEYDYKAIRSQKSKNGYHDTFNALYPLLPSQSLVMTSKNKFKQIDLMNYKTTTYRCFMNNTQLPWRKVITGANTGRNALVLCDSFGNVFTPYLLPYYNEVHMADFRYGSYSEREVGGSIGEMIRKYGIDDVYIITSTANGLRKDNSIVYLRKYLEG